MNVLAIIVVLIWVAALGLMVEIELKPRFDYDVEEGDVRLWYTWNGTRKYFYLICLR